MKPKNSNAENTSESRFLGTISTASLRNLLPRSISTKHSKSFFTPKIAALNAENTPPLHPNVQADESAFAPKPVPSDLPKSETSATHNLPVKVFMKFNLHLSSNTEMEYPIYYFFSFCNSKMEHELAKLFNFQSEIDGSDGEYEIQEPSDPAVKVFDSLIL
jgi:hypothetical protein